MTEDHDPRRHPQRREYLLVVGMIAGGVLAAIMPLYLRIMTLQP